MICTSAVILAGGLGSRLMEETQSIPKPMVTVGSHPCIWHIMKTYSHYGVRHFIVLAGYKQEVIKQYFSSFNLFDSDIRVKTYSRSVEVLNSRTPDWTVDIYDTGDSSLTGRRLAIVKDKLPDKFFLTYGDGFSDVNIDYLLQHHLLHSPLVTLTAVSPAGRFGSLNLDGDRIVKFSEKPPGDNSLINGGFMVFDKQALDFLPSDNVTLEEGLLAPLATHGHLSAYQHEGFWQPMDTLRDRYHLESLWKTENCPWRIWGDD